MDNQQGLVIIAFVLLYFRPGLLDPSIQSSVKKESILHNVSSKLFCRNHHRTYISHKVSFKALYNKIKAVVCKHLPNWESSPREMCLKIIFKHSKRQPISYLQRQQILWCRTCNITGRICIRLIHVAKYIIDFKTCSKLKKSDISTYFGSISFQVKDGLCDSVEVLEQYMKKLPEAVAPTCQCFKIITEGKDEKTHDWTLTVSFMYFIL